MTISKTEWEKMVRKADFKARQQVMHERNALRRFVNTLKRALTFELLIGLIAAFSLYVYFGWDALFKTLLNWVIGITMVSTVITIMVDKYKKLLHLNK
ncbi:MAG: hypothetical protein V3V78_01135 [Candidatus Woesearchaeota archaeon]